MQDGINDYLRDVVAWHREFVGRPPAEPQLLVTREQAFMQVSTDLLMDMGIIPDTRPPREYKPLPWRTRFRWWRHALRDRIATWAYERISGDDFPSPDD